MIGDPLIGLTARLSDLLAPAIAIAQAICYREPLLLCILLSVDASAVVLGALFDGPMVRVSDSEP